MADLLPQAELEFRILLLPPISRGTRLEGPALHAKRLCELWKVEDGDVALGEAFRLLDASIVAGVLWRIITTDNFADRCTDPRYWIFPSLDELVPALREEAWQEMLAGTLTVEAIKGVRGKRHRVVLPAELARLVPDWKLLRLTLDGRDEFIDARVRRRPAESVKKAWRERRDQAAIKNATLQIAKRHPPGTQPPSASEFWGELKELLGPTVTREQARNALKDYAPHLIGRRGYSKGKSPG
jgi:hypothetical protein